MKKSFLYVMLCLTLILTVTFPSVYAEGVSGGKTASPTALTPENRETAVELSLSAGTEKEKYDVVFVLDASCSGYNEDIYDSIIDDGMMMLKTATSKDAIVRVAIIKFKGISFDAIKMASGNKLSGLVEYSKDTHDIIDNAMRDGTGLMELMMVLQSRGTNLHGGLVAAQQLLEADKTVADDHKYIIGLSDGKSYIWNDAAGNPTCFYSQNHKHYEIQNNGFPQLGQTVGRDKLPYPVNVLGNKAFAFSEYQKLYESTNSELTDTEKCRYDAFCYYAKGDSKASSMEGTVKTYSIKNPDPSMYHDYSNYIEFTLDPQSGSYDKWKNIVWLQANPYAVVKNEDGSYSYDKERVNGDFYQYHPDTLQKGLYKAGHLWTELGEKYHTGFIAYDGWSSQTGLEIALSFDNWICKNSEYGAKFNKSAECKKLFESIGEDIQYNLDHGIVTDLIPGEFDLILNGTGTFTVKEDGSALSVKEESGNTWVFGTPDGNNQYPYRVLYIPADKIIRWEINIPLLPGKSVSLLYGLEIKEHSAGGEHDTNVSAVLDYTDSKGGTKQYVFPIPKVTYSEQYTVAYEAQGDDTYGFPPKSSALPKVKKYNYRDDVIIEAIPTTDCDYAIVNGKTVMGSWRFDVWDRENFRIEEDTVVHGCWVFTPDAPKTGDTSSPAILAMMTLLGFMGYALLAGRKRKE